MTTAQPCHSEDPTTVLWERRTSGRQYFRARGILDQCPPLLQAALAERYARVAGPEQLFYNRDDGRIGNTYSDADEDLRRVGRELRKAKPGTAFDDDAIERAARTAAHHCLWLSPAGAVTFAESQGVKVPAGPRVTAKSVRRRLVNCHWWRRRLRTILTRQCEELFRTLGFVRRQSSPYVSGDALERVRSAQIKGRRWLADMLAVCQDTGEWIPLAQLAERSLANPAKRRGELMLRARGFQETAESQGHRCLMVTLTAPSAFHPWLQTGEANPRYNGSTPRDAQRWLNQHWARARAALKRRRTLYYGFRCAEPHHDATPHWHLVIYAPADALDTLRTVVSRVWLKDYPDEPGAAQHRVKFTDENPERGSGVGYLAKYVAKNVDGYGSVGAEASDESGRPVSEDAARAVAWSRVHGIRQFQQLGGPAVTLWRELRRVREPCEWEPLEALRVTTDHTDQGAPSWARFIAQLGGIGECLGASRSLFDKAEPRCIDSAGRNVLRLTRWGELPAPLIVGLRIVWRDRIRRLPTRIHVWFLVFAPQRGALFSDLGPVAITVLSYGAPAGWTNPQETSQAPPC